MKKYSESWKKPKVYYDIEKSEEKDHSVIDFIRPDDKTGIFNGIEKNRDKDILFASVQTLGQSKYLNEDYFKKDEFDYIIMDEFHHAVSSNHIKIIDYFTPKFLLGLTATPERLDSKDVFSLCDYNTVYEIRLSDAINKEYLLPFRYYGIYDQMVDYKNIEFKNGKYNDASRKLQGLL